MLCFSDSDTVETWKDGKCNTYDIVVSKGDSPFKILKHTTNKKSGHGTRISAFVLRHLPDAAAMTDILSARFLYDPKFVVKINGHPTFSLIFNTLVLEPEVKHWHGAKKDSWFSHIAIEVPGEDTSNEWCEPVSDEQYDKLENK